MQFQQRKSADSVQSQTGIGYYFIRTWLVKILVYKAPEADLS